MDDCNFYLINDFCGSCNAVTPHEAFEVSAEKEGHNQNNNTIIEHHCEHCQQRNN